MAYGKGHCKGSKKERKSASAWYQAIEAQHIARITAEWAKQQAAQAQAQTKKGA